MKKTWAEKFEYPTKPTVQVVDKAMLGITPGQKMLISTPREIAEAVKQVKKGSTLTVAELRTQLAQAHQADVTCPLTTGIFLRIGSELALEQLAAGESITKVMPFWRVVDEKSPLAKKLTCGPQFIADQRAAESA